MFAACQPLTDRAELRAEVLQGKETAIEAENGQTWNQTILINRTTSEKGRVSPRRWTEALAREENQVFTAFGQREADQQQVGIAGETQVLHVADGLGVPNPTELLTLWFLVLRD